MTPYHFLHERVPNLKNGANLMKKSQRRSGHDSLRKSGMGGFTLVELIVSVGLFAIVMLVSVGALLSLTGANRKAQSLQSVMNNLNVALDGMVRSIRKGSNYHCGPGTFTGSSSIDDCPNGNTVIVFKPFGGNLNEWGYLFDTNGSFCGKNRICKSEDGGVNYVALTSQDVTIESMKFYVLGSTPGDTVQPKVVITVQGTAGAANMKTKTTFSIQATAVQRLLDL
jgi:type II secretory pathway pseudopilin PulG